MGIFLLSIPVSFAAGDCSHSGLRDFVECLKQSLCKWCLIVSQESRVKHPDDLEVLDTHSFVSWGLWRMSCVVLHILKNQALAELFTIPCLLAVPRREQSPCCLWSGGIIGQIPYHLLLSEKGRADMPWSACWALWNGTKQGTAPSPVYLCLVKGKCRKTVYLSGFSRSWKRKIKFFWSLCDRPMLS